MKTISGKKCLLDTNILLYAIDKKSSFHKEALLLFKKIENGDFFAFVSVQNLLEFGAVLSRGYKVPLKEVAEDMRLLLSNPKIKLIYPGPAVLPIFLRLMDKAPNVYIFGLFLTATALDNKIEVIISKDLDLKKIKEVIVYSQW